MDDLAALDYRTAFIIGMFQVLSLVPGTSRSGATILGGIIFGASRYVATEFTFFLAIPVMFGASFLKLVKFGWNYTGTELMILGIGMALGESWQIMLKVGHEVSIAFVVVSCIIVAGLYWRYRRSRRQKAKEALIK